MQADSSYCVLVVEDDDNIVQARRFELEACSHIDVLSAERLADARRIVRERHVDAVLVDVVLDHPDDIERDEGQQGDEWLATDPVAREIPWKMVITGFPGRIRDPNYLKSCGVRVAEKGHTGESAAVDELVEIARGDRPRPETKRRDGLEEALARGLRSRFSNWISELASELDGESVQLGGRILSLKELNDEVVAGTDHGLAILHAFFSEFGR